MNKVFTLSLIATLSTAGLALAHDGGRRGFGRMDQNQDGRVTQQEMLSAKLSRFDKADTNKDGKLTPEERAKAFEAFAKQRFTKKDKNGDGVLSQDEVGRMHARHFAKLDADGSGTLSADELRAAGRRHGKRHGHAGKAAKADEGSARAKWKTATFARSDVKQHVTKVFAKLDKNGDSVLTSDELRRGGRGGKHAGRGHGHGKGHRQAADADRDAG